MMHASSGGGVGEQLGLFDSLRRPPVIHEVDPDGGVVIGEPDFAFRLPHPRYAWDRAEIEIHQHTDGLWMWSSSWCDGGQGSCYRVGPKWGKFAETRDDALFYACRELEQRLSVQDGREAVLILEWVRALKGDQVCFSRAGGRQ